MTLAEELRYFAFRHVDEEWAAKRLYEIAEKVSDLEEEAVTSDAGVE